MTEKLKLGLAHVGTNIHYAGSSLGSTVKHKFTGHKDTSIDDELIGAFGHDVKQIMTAMKFLERQTHRMAANFWPYFFKSTINSAWTFQQLLGEDSLSFKDIQVYYDEFDRLQLTSESVLVHPKERQLLIPSIQVELTNYVATMDQLQARVYYLAHTNAKLVKIRTEALRTHLKHVMKVIKARSKQKAKCDKLEWKADRLAKRKTPLSDLEQKELTLLETKLSSAKALFDNVNERLKKVIPECLLLVEEFVEELTKWIICNQNQIYEEIERTLRYYAVFHGYVSTVKDRQGSKESTKSDEGAASRESVPSKDTQSDCKTYQQIIDEWETANTPTRLQIESFIKTIYDKDPQLVDKEVDDSDKTLKIAKAWTLMTLKVTEKLHKVKASDIQNGVFTNQTMADPLRSFTKYSDLNMNISETYHPHKILNYDEVHPAGTETRKPPALPPRNDSRPIPLPVNSPGSPVTPIIGLGFSAESYSLKSDSELSLSSISDTESESGTTSEVSSILLADDTSPDRTERQIIKLYNSAKNEIKEAPVDTSLWVNLDSYYKQRSVFDNKNTISYKLHELNNFFHKALEHATESSNTLEKKMLEAKKDFEGANPGDLSFAAGDKIEVVFDLQSVSLTYNNDGRNWFVGATGEPPHRRLGFAPNTYF